MIIGSLRKATERSGKIECYFGKGEVGSSILPCGTSFFLMFQRVLAACRFDGAMAAMQNDARTCIGVCHKSGTTLAQSVRKAFLTPASKESVVPAGPPLGSRKLSSDI